MTEQERFAMSEAVMKQLGDEAVLNRLLSCGTPMRLVDRFRSTFTAWQQAVAASNKARDALRAASQRKRESFKLAETEVRSLRLVAGFTSVSLPEKPRKNGRRNRRETAVMGWWLMTVAAWSSLSVKARNLLAAYGRDAEALDRLKTATKEAEAAWSGKRSAVLNSMAATRTRWETEKRHRAVFHGLKRMIRAGMNERTASDRRILDRILRPEVCS